jgi:hypothetical protein
MIDRSKHFKNTFGQKFIENWPTVWLLMPAPRFHESSAPQEIFKSCHDNYLGE